MYQSGEKVIPPRERLAVRPNSFPLMLAKKPFFNGP
jgi:hypothetical protein